MVENSYGANNGSGGNRNNNNRQNTVGNNQPVAQQVKPRVDPAKFKTWITKGANVEMTEFAEEAAKYLGTDPDSEKKQDKPVILTRSKFRNIYGEIKRIQAAGWSNEKTSFYLLRPKVAYLVGREGGNVKVKFFQEIFEEAMKNVSDDNEKTYQNFCDFMEAVIAYHRVYSKD